MTMKRRGFIVGSAAAAATVAVNPLSILKPAVKPFTTPATLLETGGQTAAIKASRFAATDWAVDVNKTIRYVGAEHGSPAASYMTVLDLHEWLRDEADQLTPSPGNHLDITDPVPSQRVTDNIIQLGSDFKLDDDSSQHLYGGSVIDGEGSTWDSIINFGRDPDIELRIDGVPKGDSWWNLSRDSFTQDQQATQGITHQFMIPKQDRITVFSHEVCDVYSDLFPQPCDCGTDLVQDATFRLGPTSRGVNCTALYAGVWHRHPAPAPR